MRLEEINPTLIRTKQFTSANQTSGYHLDEKINNWILKESGMSLQAVLDIKFSYHHDTEEGITLTAALVTYMIRA